MKKILLIFAAVWMISAGLLSCSSVPYSRWNSSSAKVIELINSPGDEYLTKITASPFLFDREIIILEKDIAMIWKNIDEAGFCFEEAYEAESMPVSAGDYRLFADTMEVKTWFEKYLPEKASVVKIKAKNGLYYMILGGKKWITVVKEEPQFGFSFGYAKGPLFMRISNNDDDGTGPSNEAYPVIYGFTGPVREGGR